MDFQNLIKKASRKAIKFQSGFIYQYAFIMLTWFFCIINLSDYNIMNYPILSSLILFPLIGAIFIFISSPSS